MLTIATIAILHGEGFPSAITQEFTPDSTEIFRFRGDFDIDADGANGQHGLPAAYRPDNHGTDILADIGYPRSPDEYSEGLICRPGTREPIVFPGGIFASRTALRMPGFDSQDPRSGVDAEFYPYAVVPPIIRQKAKGIVLGCYGQAINHANGKVADFVVADIGPSQKDGEGSPALARLLGINPSPRTGGEDSPVIEYIIYPGRAALIKGTQFVLQHA